MGEDTDQPLALPSQSPLPLPNHSERFFDAFAIVPYLSSHPYRLLPLFDVIEGRKGKKVRKVVAGEAESHVFATKLEGSLLFLLHDTESSRESGVKRAVAEKSNALLWQFRLKSVYLHCEISLKSVDFEVRNQLKSVDCHVMRTW